MTSTKTLLQDSRTPGFLLIALGALLAASPAAIARPAKHKPAAVKAADKAGARNEKKEALRLYKEATRLYRAASYREAIAKYEESHALNPHLNNVYYIAESYRRLGEPRKSHEQYQRYMAMLPQSKQAEFAKKLASLRFSRPSTLSIASTPGGADLRLDSTPAGKTPADGTPVKLEVSGGMHVLEASLQGHLPLEKKVTAEFGEPLALSFALQPLLQDPVLVVQTKVEGALVHVDGKTVGTTPVTLTLPPGPHALRVSRFGHKEVTRQLELRAGQTEQVSLTLVPEVEPAAEPGKGRDEASAAGAQESSTGRPENAITVQLVAGPVWMDFGRDDLVLGAGTQFGMEVGYMWRFRHVGISVDAAAHAMSLNDRTRSGEGDSWLISLYAGPQLRWFFLDRVWAGLSFQLGATTLLGTREDSFFFAKQGEEVAEVSGAFSMLAFRPQLTAGWEIWRGLTLFVTPFAMDYALAHDLFTVDRVVRYGFAGGAGWMF